MSSPTIWGPSLALNLQPGEQFGLNGASVQSGSINPTSVATAGQPGSLYLSTSSGLFYVKTDTGTTTNWYAVGASAITNPTFYTPTLSGFGTGPTLNFAYWRQIGDCMEIVANITGGTSPTGQTTVSLPTGYITDNTGKLPTFTYQVVGSCGQDNQGVTVYPVATQNDTSIRFCGFSSSSQEGATNPINIVTAGQLITFVAKVPIQGFTANTGVPSGALPTNIQTFTSSGTWTKPAGNVQRITVAVLGAGGGGGSGRKGLATTANSGGAGGASGSFCQYYLIPSQVASTVTVTVGAGGAGGTAVSTNDTTGNAGTSGGLTSFGPVQAPGGGGGGGGQLSAAATAGTGNGSTNVFGVAGLSGGVSSATGGNGTAAATVGIVQPTGGGGAGGTTTAGVASTGAGGGTISSSSTTQGAMGTAGGNGGAVNTSGTNGNSNTYYYGMSIGTGGGAGGASATASTNAGSGGNGGGPGAGGGGGGAATDPAGNSGAGGNGIGGWAVIITEF